MNVSAPFIHRPIATSLLMLVLVLAGTAAYQHLPIAALPQVELPAIQVSASLSGASANVMATSVAAPLERQLALVPGLTEMTSTSSLGQTAISLQFDLDRSIDAAAQDVQAALNAASGDLPRGLPRPPSYEKANPADFLIMSLAVHSATMPLREQDVYADAYIAQQLSRVRGVGMIDLHGEQRPAVRVQVDPHKLAQLGLGLEQVRAVLGASTANAPKGSLEGPDTTLAVDATDQLTSAAAFDDLVLAYHNGAAVHVRDVGRALDDVEDAHQRAWFDGKPAIIVDIHKQPGFNVVETVAAVKQALPELVRAIPASVQVDVVGDRTRTIEAAVNEIQATLLLTIALVVGVVFLFLRGVWVTLIPALAIPLSIACTFVLMERLGYSVNNLTLMGLTVATGFMVDDAIVVIENIVRHRELGLGPLEAALEGSREVGFTVVSMTLSLVAALIPLLLMGGLVGRLFREFSVTVGAAILASGVVSLVLTPMLGRVLLGRDAQVRPESPFERAFAATAAAYARSLDRVLRRRWLTFAATVAVALATGLLYWQTPKGFFPPQDTGVVSGSVETLPGTSLDALAEREQRALALVQADPDVEHVYGWAGGGSSTGRFGAYLQPFERRHATPQQVIARLMPQARQLPGVVPHMQAVQALSLGGRSSQNQFQYTLEDNDLDELYAWVPRLMERVRTLPEILDVSSDYQAAAPGVGVVIDRARASALGISPQLIDDTLYDALGQRQVATIFSHVDQRRVVLELLPAFRTDLAALRTLYVAPQVPLTVVARLESAPQPLQIIHQGQFPALTLAFDLVPGTALGDAIDHVQAAINALGMPPTLHGGFQGTARAFAASLASQPWLIATAILAVYVVLGILYESYIHPLTILSTLPSAGLGALVALNALHYELTLVALIGIILLIGIVKKNAIMMVDFALDAERHHGLSPEDAIRQACVLRFRPIMMTTAAAILGGLPLALGHGPGAEVRAPLGVAIVGGLVLSQVLTLYTTPVIYLLLGRLHRPGRSSP
ncbi:MAG: acriflavine resistance protein [Cyanobacteria bacterium RYN_339]|nr:acriflavine resistance protein [Cyanobacteria bacterium RYN_339]